VSLVTKFRRCGADADPGAQIDVISRMSGHGEVETNVAVDFYFEADE